MADDSRILTTTEAAKLLQVSYETCRRHLHAGTLPGRKVGRSWRVVESELRRWIMQEPRDER